MQHTTPICGKNQQTLQCVDLLFDEAERLLLSDIELNQTAALGLLRLATAALRQHTDAYFHLPDEADGYRAMMALDSGDR